MFFFNRSLRFGCFIPKIHGWKMKDDPQTSIYRWKGLDEENMGHQFGLIGYKKYSKEFLCNAVLNN